MGAAFFYIQMEQENLQDCKTANVHLYLNVRTWTALSILDYSAFTLTVLSVLSKCRI